MVSSVHRCDRSSFTQCPVVNTLSTFALIQCSEAELNCYTTLSSKVVQQLSSATCALDPMPTTLFKNVFTSLVDDVLEIVNASLFSGIFPTSLKHAIITLLKSQTFHSWEKIFEKVLYQQLYMCVCHVTICLMFICLVLE